MRICARAGLIFSLFFFILTFAAVTGDAETIRVALDPGEVLTSTDPDGMTAFKGADLQRLNPVGAPNLPWQVVDVLLPPDAELGSVAVRLENTRWEAVTGAIQIAPAPSEMTWQDGRPEIDWPGGKQFIDGRDAAIYDGDTDYPVVPVKLISTGRMRQWRLAQVGLALFRWHPKGNQLRRLIRGELTVTFTRRTSHQAALERAKELQDPIATDDLRQLAVNFASQVLAYTQALKELTPSSDSGTDTELSLSGEAGTYVILTTTAIQTASSELSNFVAHKANQGFTVQVVTESGWGDGTGDSAAENIRAWLQANYVSESISHVLLIGNPNPSTGEVPMKLIYPKAGYTSPTDYYYADLTGNWDLDGDGNFGEFEEDFGVGGVDRYWEVLVGRIPYYGDIGDLDGILARLIAYQNTPAAQTEWRKNVLLPMDDLGGWEYPLSDRLGEDIRDDILSTIGWPSHRIYDTNTLGLDPPPETMPCTEDNVVNVWSQTPFGLVVWFTHGSSTSATDVIDSYRVDELNDTYPSFTFQASCNTAYPENSSNLAYALLREGGISTIGATRLSWSLSGHYIAGEATIEGMAYEYTKRVTAMGMPAARALNMLRQKIVPNSNYSGQWMNYVDCNVYGDPDTTLYASPRPVHNLTRDKRYPVIQWAVDDADEGDEIVLDPGTYTGFGNREIDFFGKNLTLRSIDPADPAIVAATIIDAQGTMRIFEFYSGEDSRTLIQGFTLTGANDCAIYCRNASPTVIGCVFSNNSGRGVYLNPGDMRIEDSRFETNGGGIENSNGSPQIKDCLFTANTDDRGAGVYTSGGETLISGCTFSGNTATSQGGGLYGAGSSQISLVVEDCLFSGNISQDQGGGLFLYSNVNLTNTVITGNTAINRGGGLMAPIGNLFLTNCTLVNNRADTGGGMALLGTTAAVDNAIVWYNEAVSNGHQIALIAHFSTYYPTTLAADSCAFDGGPADVYVENTTCNFSWSNIISTNPELVDPGTWVDDGTPGDLFDDTWHPGDYHLTAVSPCIDTGNDTALHLPALDFDGDARIMDGDGDGTTQVDIGADEYGQTTPCESDLDIDGDVDGSDLAMQAGDPSVVDLSVFAMEFGQVGCGP
jgi:Peptidase family C25/Chlamydia polymorphic membrane protein (Chlamydia_PMP) repeat